MGTDWKTETPAGTCDSNGGQTHAWGLRHMPERNGVIMSFGRCLLCNVAEIMIAKKLSEDIEDDMVLEALAATQFEARKVA